MLEIMNQFPTINALEKELNILKEGYDILESLYLFMDNYHPTIDGKEVSPVLLARMHNLFGFDDGE